MSTFIGKTWSITAGGALLAILAGVIPPGYAGLFGLAYEHGALTESRYSQAMLLLRVVSLPGRALLEPTPFDGALAVTHGEFWKGLMAAIVGNTLAWLAIIVLVRAGVMGLRRRISVARGTSSGEHLENVEGRASSP